MAHAVKKSLLGTLKILIEEHNREFPIKEKNLKLYYDTYTEQILKKIELVTEAEKNTMKWLIDIAEYLKGLKSKGGWDLWKDASEVYNNSLAENSTNKIPTEQKLAEQKLAEQKPEPMPKTVEPAAVRPESTEPQEFMDHTDKVPERPADDGEENSGQAVGV